ncbi:MAG: aspartate aminotransferase family protein [Acidimicrobiia bacterium]
MSSFWHPFAQMWKVDANPFVVERGDGVYLYDGAGKQYLDGTGALWFCQIGYGRQEMADAIAAQARELHAFHTFGDYSNPRAEELASRIASIAPLPRAKVFFTSGGSDSVDTAAKLTRRYFNATGQSDRTVFVYRDWAYHGMHAFGTTFSGMDMNFEGHGPMIQDVVKVPWDSVEDLAEVIERTGPDRIAGMFAEPIIGAGGVRFPPEGYLKGAQELIHEAGGFFISDEVITGFGRTGAWFASTRFGLEPDLITFAKGVTSGYQPLGGVIAAANVAEPFWSSAESPMWRHGYTYSGHAVAAAAGMANLDIMQREGLVERSLALESDLVEALAPVGAHALVSHIRHGAGFLAGVQIDEERVAADPDLPFAAADACRDSGLLSRAMGGGALQISPPLVMTKEHLDELAERMVAGLDAVG